MNFLEALVERHRMPAIFRIRTQFDQLWEHENSCCRSRSRARWSSTRRRSTSIGERIGEQTGRKVELSSKVDPDVLGGIVLRVGNFILDASIRNRLNQLRKQVAQA